MEKARPRSKPKHANFKHRHKQSSSQADSAFLSLPSKIRTLIYRCALVKPSDIDLCPPNLIADPSSVPSLTARLQKPRPTHRTANSPPRFRHQADLEHVRTRLAVGLLRTCRQVFGEAAPLFWGGNVWRFSADEPWACVRRFLATAGPRARGMLRRLDALPPVQRELGGVLVADAARGVACGGRVKNHPKLRLVKGDGNMAFVVDGLLRRAPGDAVLDLRFVVPKGWSLDGNKFGSHVQRAKQFAARSQSAALAGEDLVHFPHFLNLGWLKKVVVVEEGGQLLGEDYVAVLGKEGVDVIVEKGAKMLAQSGPDGVGYGVIEVESTRRYESSPARYDYLAGVRDLFEANVVVSRNGGKATKQQGQRSTARVLKGFGGCRFVHYYGYYCRDCGGGSLPQKITEYGQPLYPPTRHCVVRWASLTPAQQAHEQTLPLGHWARRGVCRWILIDCVGVKNGTRAVKQGLISNAITGRLW